MGFSAFLLMLSNRHFVHLMAVNHSLPEVAKYLPLKSKAIWEAYWHELWRVSSFGVHKLRLCLKTLRRLNILFTE